MATKTKLNDDQRKALDGQFAIYASLLKEAADEKAVTEALRRVQAGLNARYVREFAKFYTGSTRMRKNVREALDHIRGHWAMTR